ncbi:MAG: MFS transporter [Armatimonadota bacterium]
MSEAQPEPEQNGKPAPGIFLIGCVNGGFVVLASSLLDPETVLPAFTMRLMEGNVLWVGLIYAALQAGRYWPQIFLSRYMETVSRMLPYYYLALALRIVTITAAAVVLYLFAASSPQLTFGLVVVLFFMSFSAVSLGLIPFMEIVNQKVSARTRGRFFSLRYMAGGLAAFGGSFIVKYLLSADSGLTFPLNYTTVFLAGAASLLISVFVFAFIKDEGRRSAKRQLSMKMHMARGARMVSENDNLRRLGKGRALNRAAASLAFPFVVPYALKVLAMPEPAVGLLLSAKMLTYSMSNWLWTYISERWGNRAVTITCSATLIAVPVLTMVSAYLPRTIVFSLLGIGVSWRLLTILCVAIMIGASLSGALVGYNAFLLDILPERKRTTFLGFYYLMLLPTAVVPIIAALIVGDSNFSYTMILALLTGIISTIEVLRLKDHSVEAPQETASGIDG